MTKQYTTAEQQHTMVRRYMKYLAQRAESMVRQAVMADAIGHDPEWIWAEGKPMLAWCFTRGRTLRLGARIGPGGATAKAPLLWVLRPSWGYSVYEHAFNDVDAVVRRARKLIEEQRNER